MCVCVCVEWRLYRRGLGTEEKVVALRQKLFFQEGVGWLVPEGANTFDFFF